MEKYKRIILLIAIVLVIFSTAFYVSVEKHYLMGVDAREALNYAEKALAYYSVGYKGITVRDTHIKIYSVGKDLMNKDFSHALLLNFYPNARAYKIKPIGTNAFVLYGNRTDHFVVFYNYNSNHIYLIDASLTSGSGLKLAESPFAYQFAEFALDPNGRYPR